MEKTAELVEAIASASKEQAVGIEQINRAVAEMDKTTQNYAATAEEMAASAAQFRTGSTSPPEAIGRINNEEIKVGAPSGECTVLPEI